MAAEAAAAERGRKVVVAIDESDVSLYALRWALDTLFIPWAAGAPDHHHERPTSSLSQLTHLTLLHVQQPFHTYFFPSGPGPAAALYTPTSIIDSVKKAQEENTNALFARALRVCEDRMVKAVTMVMEGDPKDMICHAAEQINPDLVVVGSRGLGKVKRALLGSVSDYCAHHVKCAVLIVKPPPTHTHK
ncbi:hypothetical protein Syun_002351 [Stephania yunnanensis]|uniref:UspA domain-containing protein n=1 Tax=Stephania yunnanensis TaxID=152371 RepID=A0AAP0LFM2_9MAGN